MELFIRITARKLLRELFGLLQAACLQLQLYRLFHLNAMQLKGESNDVIKSELLLEGTTWKRRLRGEGEDSK